jgi:hypothetical protein
LYIGLLDEDDRFRLVGTKASDCLPALSGLAAHFSQLMHGENLYWLWTKGFPLSLLWFCKEYAQPIYGHFNYLTLFCAA